MLKVNQTGPQYKDEQQKINDILKSLLDDIALIIPIAVAILPKMLFDPDLDSLPKRSELPEILGQDVRNKAVLTECLHQLGANGVIGLPGVRRQVAGFHAEFLGVQKSTDELI